jgi:hypothetical protein
MSVLHLGPFSALLLTVGCVAKPAQPSGTDSFNGPPPLSSEEFAAATAADLLSHDDLDGRDAVAANVDVGPPDTFSSPPMLAAATKPEVPTWRLPYEMIVVATY